MHVPGRPLSRRTVVQAGLVLPLGSRIQPATPEVSPTPSLEGTRLRVLMPEHPLASYNDAIRALGTNWGSAQGVAIEIDLVPEDQIPTAFATGLELGMVHDLLGTNRPLLHLASALRNLEPLSRRLTERFGPAADACNAATRLPDGSRPAISIAYAPAPLIYRRSIWERYGLPDGPTTWEQVRETGAQIWNGDGMSLSFGLAPESGSERFATMLLTAFGASMLDRDGGIALDAPETVDAVAFAAGMYRDAMTPESLDWSTERRATLLADGIVSIIAGDISALRLAQERNVELANDLFLAPPPFGPSGEMFPATPASSYRAFQIPREAASPGAAEAFLIMLVESSEILVGASRLSERPAYGSIVPGLVQAGGWLENDPYGAMPPGKLAMLTSSAAWTSWPGAPGPAGPVAARAEDDFLLSRMLARAATGEQSPADSVAQAVARLEELIDA